MSATPKGADPTVRQDSLSLPQPLEVRPEGDRSWWKSAAVLVAVITVLGTAGGSILSCQIQRRDREKEFELAYLQARGAQALAIYKEYSDQERVVVTDAYALIGATLAATDDLLMVMHPDWDRMRSPFEERFNKAETEWRLQRAKIGLLMRYYHPRVPFEASKESLVEVSWRRTAERMTQYTRCAALLYEGKGSAEDPRCEGRRRAVEEALRQLEDSLQHGRRYAWEGWESPRKLRESWGPDR